MRFFHNPILKTNALIHTDVSLLLQHVHYGHQEQAESLLKNKPHLIYKAGRVTDFSNRTFQDITVFQSSLWTRDWTMWEMILQYMPHEEARKQLMTLEKNQTEYGAYFDFHELIDTLTTYLAHFDTWTCYQLGKHWCEVIGGAQTRAVAHVANQLCHPYRSHIPIPDFMEASLPRSFDLAGENNFFPLKPYPAGVLGKDFAVFRWNKDRAGIGTMKPCPNARVTAETDLATMIALENRCHTKLAELKASLGLEPTSSKRNTL